MARNTNIKLRRSATAGAIPTTSNLDLGELALNTYDGKLYAKTTEGSASEVIQVGSSTDSYHKIRKSQTLSIAVTVAAKTSDHVHYNTGSSNGYYINGLQSPHLHLVPGNTYRFDQSDSSNSGHPLRFYYEAAKTTTYTTGVTTNGTPGSSGAYTQIIATDTTPPVLHYGCSAHGYMGGRADFSTRNLTGFDSDDLTQGSNNIFYTDALARAALSGGTGISYSSATGVITNTITQYANSDVEAYLDANGITLPDNIKVQAGTGNDLQLYHDANNSYIKNDTGDLILDLANDLTIDVDGGDIKFKDAGTVFGGFSQSSGSMVIRSGPSDTAMITGDSDGDVIMGGDVALTDNKKLLLGADNDLQIFHDGSISNIKDAGTGILQLTTNGAAVQIYDSANTTTMARFNTGGAVNLNYAGTLRLATTATGINVNGTTVSDAETAFSTTANSPNASLVVGNTASSVANGNYKGAVGFARGDNTLQVRSAIVGKQTHTSANRQGLAFLVHPDSVAGTLNEAFVINHDSTASFSSDLTITGNLTVNGTTTTLNTATLDVEDKNITLNKGSGDTSSSANGAGITIQDAVNASTDATLLWDASDDEFDFSHAITAPGATIASLTYPSSDGSSGQALVTDGSGNLSFSSISAGGNAFGTIAVSGQSNIAADSNSDTLTIVAGSNITLSSNAGTDTLTIAASGGEITVQEEGSSLSTAATTLNFVGSAVTATGSGATKTITVSGGEITVQDEGSSLSTAAQTVNFVGAGVTASGTGSTKTITIPGGGGEVFKTIAVSGQSDVVADSATDTLTLAAGSGMTIATNASSDTITFTSSGSTSQSGVFTEFIFAPSSSTTTFSGSDANSNTLSYTVGAVDVFLNGVKLRPTTDFTATNGSSVVLVNAASSGDVLQINSYTQVLGFGDSNLSELTGDNSTTAFTIAANPNHENNTQVYIDGVYQEKSTYSVSGTTLTFSTAPPSGASIEVVIGSRNVTIDDVSGLTVNGDLTVDTSTLYVDSTNNRVGIGTTSPDYTLESNSGTIDWPAKFKSSDDKAGIILADNDTTNYIMSQNSYLSMGGTASLSASNLNVHKTTGFVGIGTTSPGVPLHIVDDSNILLKIASSSSSNNARMTFAPNNSEKWNIGVNISNSDFTFYDVSNTTTPVRFEDGAANNTLVVDSNSRIGIGMTGPGVSLDVGTKTDAIRVPNGTTGQRPTAALGQLRYNTTTSEFEGYAAGAWGKIGGGGDSFGTIAVSGQSNVVAEQENDTLTLVGAGGITITTAAGSDTVTLTGQTSVNPFTTDLFTTANNSTTAFTLSVTPPSEDNLIVFLEGAYQNKNSYALSGTTLTLDSAPASGAEVVVHIIQNGVVGAGHIVDEFTGDGSDTTFTLSVTPLNENNTFVYLDGVYQEKSVYSVSGTTLTFATAPVSGHSIEVVTPQVAQVNQPAAGSIDNVNMFSGLQASEITSTTMTTTSATTIATHAAATYRTVKYLVQLTQGTDYHSTEINLIHDGTTVYITEYGTLFDNAALGTLNASISSGNILLQLTPGSNSSLTARVVSTAIPV